MQKTKIDTLLLKIIICLTSVSLVSFIFPMIYEETGLTWLLEIFQTIDDFEITGEVTFFLYAFLSSVISLAFSCIYLLYSKKRFMLISSSVFSFLSALFLIILAAKYSDSLQKGFWIFEISAISSTVLSLYLSRKPIY